MRITRFIRQKDAAIGPSETLHAAAAQMRSLGVSALPVDTDGVIVALITERDLVRALATSTHPSEARVYDYMRYYPVGIGPYDDATVALVRMFAIGCLDLPVVDDNRLVGVVSAQELLAAQTMVSQVAV